MKELETYAASLIIGLVLGCIGAGGSILTIPVFVFVLKKDPLSSGVYSMFVVGISGVAGSIRSILNKLVDFKAVITFGLPSVLGVFIARKLIFPCIPAQLFSIGSFSLSKNMLFMLLLSVLMFLAAIRMLKPIVSKDKAAAVNESSLPLLLIQGIVVGMMTGLLGIGGGFLIVPALYFLAVLPAKKAIGTALLIITVNSLLSFLSSYTSMDIDWPLLIKFSSGAILGILIGRMLSDRIDGEQLKKIFAWFIICMSIYILYKQFSNVFY